MVEEKEKAQEAPPPYCPQRPPPPYKSNEIKISSQCRIAPPVSTPFSIENSASTAVGSTTATIHPMSLSPPVIVVTGTDGVNPSCGVQISAAASSAIKKADTAEPYEEFCPKCQVGSLQISSIMIMTIFL